MGSVVAIDTVALKAKIDRYGELQRRVQEFKPTQTEYEALGKEIDGWYEDQPDQAFNPEGDLFSLQISPRSNERVIFDKSKVRRLMGAGKFFELCQIALKHVDSLIDESKHHLFLKQERTGPRKKLAVAKASPKVAA